MGITAEKVLSLDPSLTSTGWASAEGHGVLKPPRSVGKDVGRLIWIRDQVMKKAESMGLVVIEGYAYNTTHYAHQLGELGGVLRVSLTEAGVPFVVVSPGTVKRVATGRGNAGKELVLVEAVKRLGYDGADNNEADALWIRQTALHGLGLPEAVKIPKKHLELMEPEVWEDFL